MALRNYVSTVVFSHLKLLIPTNKPQAVSECLSFLMVLEIGLRHAVTAVPLLPLHPDVVATRFLLPHVMISFQTWNVMPTACTYFDYYQYFQTICLLVENGTRIIERDMDRPMTHRWLETPQSSRT